MTRTLALCGGLALLLAACDATNTTLDVGQGGTPEGIASATLTLSSAADTTETIEVTGLEGAAPVVTGTLALVPGAQYSGSLRLDEEADAEIQAEAESHLYTYPFSSDALAVTRTDTESQYTSINLNDGDYSLGRALSLAVSADASGTGTLTVRLLHYEGSPKGAADAGGTEDISFQVPVVFETAG